MSTVTERVFEDRFVLFFDFLGSSEAAVHWPQARQYELVDLLRSIALNQSSEEISGQSQENGSYSLSVMPEITTFSDNIVASWSGAQNEDIPELAMAAPFWTDIVCQEANRILANVAEAALRIGVLIRGGFSFGQMYHQDGAAFGEAMVDAVHLEGEIAHYPRVIVSDRIIRLLTDPTPERCPWISRDPCDGLWHLNYIERMLKQAIPIEDDTAAPNARLTPEGRERQEHLTSQVSRWKNAHLQRINHEHQALEHLGAINPAAKWAWFRERFATATARVPD